MCILRFFVANILVVLLVCFITTKSYSQKAVLRGTVIDEKSGVELPGANVVVKSSEVATGTATGTDGSFEILNLPPGTYTVTVSYIGYGKKTFSDIVLTAGETRTFDISLIPIGIDFNPITVTAARRPEKLLEAPADVIVLVGEEIEARPVLTPAEHLKSVPGIDVISSGLNAANVVIRGFNNVSSTKLLSLVDNRIARVPSIRVNAYQFLPTNNNDVEDVEIVLGPGSALYGPNASSGVMHIITKSPITSPGTTVSVGVGERSVFMESFRHSMKISDRVGFKISGQYYRGHEWEFDDPAEPDSIVKGLQTENGRIDIGGKNPNERDFDVEKIATEGAIEFRPNDHTKLIFNGGFNIGNNIELTTIGAAQGVDWTYSYAQARLTYKNLFIQGFMNRSDAGDTFLLRTGNLVLDNSKLLAAQIQHNLTLGDRQRFTYGFDAFLTRPNTKNTLNGRNESDDSINDLGVYLQSETQLTSKLKFVGAARVDDNSRLDDLIFSPRTALVFKPSPTNNFRITFNRAFSTPNVINLFLDILATKDAFGLGQAFGNPDFGIDLRAQGVPKDGFSFRRTANGLPMYRSPFAPLAGLQTSDFIALNDPLFTNVMWGLGREAVLGTFIPTFQDRLAGQGLSPEQIAALTQNFIAIVPQQVTSVENAMRIFDTTDPDNPQLVPVADVFDVKPLKQTTTQTIEFGYKGVVADKLAIGVDLYHTLVKDFIGGQFVVTPNVFLETTTLFASLEQQFGAVLADPNNVTLNAILVNALDPPQLGGNGNGFAADELAQLFVFGTNQNGAAFIPFGTVNPEGAFDPTALILTNRNFGNISLNGVDVHVTYYINRNWNLGGNYSYYSKNFFARSATQSQNIVLNAPKHKFGAILNYKNPEAGFAGNLRMRFIDSFPVSSGVYVGEIKSYTILDLILTYDLPFSPNTRLTLSIQNLTDKNHQEIIGAPEIGRLAILRLMQTF